MDAGTGKIYDTREKALLADVNEEDLIMFDKEEMTDLQKLNMQVSLHDNKSILGKKRLNHIGHGKKRKNYT